jgi:alanine-glyoxylate transaminase/serine-glyoxylate transaminase/serine-pyruvate transaminase
LTCDPAPTSIDDRMTPRLTPLPGKPRILLGPGPSEMPSRVAAALASPLIGHLDPLFLRVMDETQDLLRRLFRTENRLTLPMSATGSGGMETCLVNLVEPGDKVLVGVHGAFGGRIADGARRLGAEVATVEAEWGRAHDPARVIEAIRAHRPALVAIVHAETSTGVLQPLDAIAAACREMGSLFLVDCVTSLGGIAVEADRWPADALFSGSQKCLSCPPGLSPATFGEHALERMGRRRHPVPSWYFDIGLIREYWGSERVYHHTAPISMVVALREALALVFEEGLEARFERHVLHAAALAAGLEALGLELLVDARHRLPMLTSVRVPAGVEDGPVRRRLLEVHGIEIGGGLGPLAGRIWRIGLMGHSSRPENVRMLLGALGECLATSGHGCDPLQAVAEADARLRS